jgi:hypothetical protein
MHALRRAAALGAALVLATGLQARHAPELHTSYVFAHFTGVAFGKPVKHVDAHMGVLMQRPDGERFWVAVEHMRMIPRGDHFFTKSKLQAWSEPGGAQVVGPVIQYWVTFADGQTMITETSAVRPEAAFVFETWGYAYADRMGAVGHEFARRLDAPRTGSFQITVRPRN